MEKIFNFAKHVCMGVGLGTIILWSLGSLGIGHFVIAYGPNIITCTKGE